MGMLCQRGEHTRMASSVSYVFLGGSHREDVLDGGNLGPLLVCVCVFIHVHVLCVRAHAHVCICLCSWFYYFQSVIQTDLLLISFFQNYYENQS